MKKYEYQTIEKAIENILLKEKGSKFIGFLYPIFTDIELKEALQKIRNLHPKATHHCYAYRMGLDGENYRINDDGEPSGSAGLPIYNQLLANDITNVLPVSYTHLTLPTIFKFSQQNIIFSLLNKFNAQVLEFNSHEQCLIRASVKTSQKENISEILSEMHLISFKFI